MFLFPLQSFPKTLISLSFRNVSENLVRSVERKHGWVENEKNSSFSSRPLNFDMSLFFNPKNFHIQ